MDEEEGLRRLTALGFHADDASVLWRHFDDAERRGKGGHGHSRIQWLEQQGFATDRPSRRWVESDGLERWDGAGSVGYLVLDAVVEATIARPPQGARLVVCERTFPTGMLGHYARRLADAGLVSVLTATSPARLGPPDGAKLAGTNPLAIGIPSRDGRHVVVDVSMGAVTWGDVVSGRASEDELVPFGGEQRHKALALAVGLQLLVDSLVREPGHGAVVLVAPASADPVPALRELADRLPGDS
ncbi:MAG TPA: Ldh family oxidoreductase [Gaiellaceae bacterium]|nr:Ldh family oxidoreductase [Gaiellaceae bacterium]